MACNFILCLHNHQPVGNVDHVLERGYTDAYNKTIDILMNYPEFKFSVHHSGPLLEWIERHHPDYLDKLRVMVDRGQLEIVGGGFYEPIFSIITESDIRGQLSMMQDYCRTKLGATPRGFWTAERVWDPEIPRLVRGFGLEYTILDNNHFQYAGLEEDDLYGYYITERLDHRLCVFPIDKLLRYYLPYHEPDDTVSYFRTKTEKLGEALFVYGDDGEKFGMWPGTYDWVFERKWLVNFIETILKHDWIITTHPSAYIERIAPKGRIYITQGSYFELSEWSLPPAAATRFNRLNREVRSWGREHEFFPFMKGGVWNNFLTKYPESNAINKRTVLLSREIDALAQAGDDSLGPITRELYRAECNCAYWHGLFGGIYLGMLRDALHHHLLLAEGMLVAARGGTTIEIIERDIWNEGSDQILVRTPLQSTVIAPHHGGGVAELGLYAGGINLFNVVARRPETYHDILRELNEDDGGADEVRSIHDQKPVAKEKGLKELLVYDPGRRYSFRDSFFESPPAAEDLMRRRADCVECGDLPYNAEASTTAGAASVTLSRYQVSGGRALSVEKTLTIARDAAGIVARYAITGAAGLIAAVTVDFNLLGDTDEHRGYEIPGVAPEDARLCSIGQSGPLTSCAAFDETRSLRIEFTTSRPATLLRHPIYTVSQSESGFEKNYQGSSLVFLFPVEADRFECTIELRVC